ncbi:glycosyltransferase [Rhizobium sp. 18055]|uniref:glycosyltransferase n=1 Tax=Rhizobium sp. 18055 TaxID=2681403 RepID=UPI001358E637|nr:glycosyltransferase [Rhizobium sp. 18055]
MTTPLVSVLMPIYNGAADLERALESILAQTFDDFEVIAINDGSMDNSATLLNAVTDPRVKVIHQDNMGLAATLNRGLSIAQGALVARQDQDDLSHPERLARQVSYLRSRPDCILLGTAAEIWVGDEPTERSHDHATEHASLTFDLLFNNPFVHSSVMMRRDFVLSIGGYATDNARQPPEDYELWSRIARHGRVANLPDRLLVYREVPQSMSRAGPNPFLDRLVTISAENLAFANGLVKPSAAIEDAAALTHSAFHRMSAKPDIRAMLSAIEKAALNIGPDDAAVQARMAERMRILQYQWMMHRTGSQWARPVLRKINRLIRRLSFFQR